MAWKLEEKIFCVTTYIETKSYKTVQTRFRRKFNFNTYPGKSQIFLWYRNFQIYGTVNKRSKKSENPSSGRKLSARSADNVEAADNVEWLDERFSDRLISRRRDTEWFPHSPDLSPPDFYLWGLLKDRVYQNNPKTIAELKLAITQNICAIKREECARVIDNFARRLQECLRRNGGHLEHVFK